MIRKPKSCEQCGIECDVNDFNLCDDCEDIHESCREGDPCVDCFSDMVNRAHEIAEGDR